MRATLRADPPPTLRAIRGVEQHEQERVLDPNRSRSRSRVLV